MVVSVTPLSTVILQATISPVKVVPELYITTALELSKEVGLYTGVIYPAVSVIGALIVMLVLVDVPEYEPDPEPDQLWNI
ncbi:hypothetical protein M1329_00220 [Candidatus Marsarchaeota archaeon]|jgi:hypothetical protein|nr:hypothetical protein [Candidatus Marsarchaeota archaeon]